MDEESFRKFQIKIILFYVKCVCPIIRCKEKDIDKFKAESSLIVSNRLDSGDLIDVKEKIFTRDIFNEN